MSIVPFPPSLTVDDVAERLGVELLDMRKHRPGREDWITHDGRLLRFTSDPTDTAVSLAVHEAVGEGLIHPGLPWIDGVWWHELWRPGPGGGIMPYRVAIILREQLDEFDVAADPDRTGDVAGVFAQGWETDHWPYLEHALFDPALGPRFRTVYSALLWLRLKLGVTIAPDGIDDLGLRDGQTGVIDRFVGGLVPDPIMQRATCWRFGGLPSGACRRTIGCTTNRTGSWTGLPA